METIRGVVPPPLPNTTADPSRRTTSTCPSCGRRVAAVLLADSSDGICDTCHGSAKLKAAKANLECDTGAGSGAGIFTETLSFSVLPPRVETRVQPRKKVFQRSITSATPDSRRTKRKAAVKASAKAFQRSQSAYVRRPELTQALRRLTPVARRRNSDWDESCTDGRRPGTPELTSAGRRHSLTHKESPLRRLHSNSSGIRALTTAARPVAVRVGRRKSATGSKADAVRQVMSADSWQALSSEDFDSDSAGDKHDVALAIPRHVHSLASASRG